MGLDHALLCYILDFDVILSMDGLTAHRVVIDCDRRWVTAYTQDEIVLHFMGISMMLYPDRARLQVEWTVDGLASKPYPRG